MSFLEFGRGVNPALERQRHVLAGIAAAFDAFEHELGGLPELKASFADVWEDVPGLDDIQAKLPAMRELLVLLQSRAKAATAELPNFDEPLKMIGYEIGYGQGLLEKLAVTVVTKQGLAASRDRD
jgi:hypothetical protein